MYHMVDVFLELEQAVDSVLSETWPKMTFPSKEITYLKMIRDVLHPICEAQNRLGADKSNVLTAEGCFQYMFKELNKIDHPFARKMFDTLETRFHERRNKKLVSLMLYLHHKRLDKDDPLLHLFPESSKKEIHSLAKDLMSRLFDIEEQVEPTDENPTIDDDLESCIALTESPAVKKKSTSTNLNDDFKHLEKTGQLSQNLQRLLEALKQITPTSVPCEHQFSISNNFSLCRHLSI